MRILLLILVAVSSAAIGADKTFEWVAPTEYVDGSPLPANELAGYRMECTPAVEVAAIGVVTSAVRSFPPGEYTCTLRAQDIFGRESDPSNAVSFSVPRPNPNPPTAFSVGS